MVRRIHTWAGACENISGSQILNCTPDVQALSVSVVVNAPRMGRLPEFLENPIDEPYPVQQSLKPGVLFSSRSAEFSQ